MRRNQILELLQANGGMRLSDLSEVLEVSEMTVRRDLDMLEKEGTIERVHGGAVLAQRGAEEPGFDKKSLREQAEKSAIAQCAVELVKPGSAIALSAGTTTCTLARYIARIDEITVVTNSMKVWHELQQDGRKAATVILTGGEFRTPSDALVGPTADAAIRSLYFDTLFLGVHGIDPTAGLTTPNISEAETNRAFISRCRKLVVVADHTKWRTTALCTMAPLSDVDVLISDDGLPPEAQRQLKSQVKELVVVPVAP
ncbi:MAG TPA: DeoR/GlpR family DNA-binding transcription regulator [Acidimicrobiales bacterium]|nr:DeoR/GlpR family DNA-binding transcription regulator [Acidimicrobiales bacterium]